MLRLGYTQASIIVALPNDKCERVSDVVEVLSTLEEVYNHLYLWCLLVEQAVNDREGVGDQADLHPNLSLFTGGAEAIPASDRLCLAGIEISPPAFVEVAGHPRVIRIIGDYLARQSKGAVLFPSEGPLESEGIEPVRCEIELLCGLNFSEGQMREVLSKHILQPLNRLERIQGIGLYEGNAVAHSSAA